MINDIRRCGIVSVSDANPIPSLNFDIAIMNELSAKCDEIR